MRHAYCAAEEPCAISPLGLHHRLHMTRATSSLVFDVVKGLLFTGGSPAADCPGQIGAIVNRSTAIAGAAQGDWGSCQGTTARGCPYTTYASHVASPPFRAACLAFITASRSSSRFAPGLRAAKDL